MNSKSFSIAACSYQGGRDHNEDSTSHLENDGVCVVVVADGLGGHGGGKIASSIVVGKIAELFMQNAEIDPSNIKDIFEQANREVVNAQSPATMMKSTGVALFINNGTMIWGHAGDTRLYHFLEGRLINQTLDHSVSQLAVVTGEITMDQIRFHADRNRVLKAFGDDERFRAEITQAKMLEPC